MLGIATGAASTHPGLNACCSRNYFLLSTVNFPFLNVTCSYSGMKRKKTKDSALLSLGHRLFEMHFCV